MSSSSITPDSFIKLKTRDLLLLGLFIAGAAFTAGGTWIHLDEHEKNGHPDYTRDIKDIRERLIRIETLLKDK